MKKYLKYCLLAMTVLVLFVTFLPFPAQGNSSNGLTYTATDGGISSDNDTSATLSISKSGLGTGSKSSTITIKNDTGNKAVISFDYVKSGSGSSYSTTINGVDSDNGSSCTVTLDAGGSFSITLSCSHGYLSSASAKIEITNIIVTPVLESSKVTVLYDTALGSIKAGNTPVANEEVVETTASAPKTLTATTNGSQFLAWTDENNKVLSTSTSFQVEPTSSSMTVKAIFAATSPWFYVSNNNYLLEGWDAAMAYGGTVVLANNATLAARDTAYNVPSNVNLLIPYSGTDTGTFGSIPKGSPLASTATPSTYRTLTVASGASITVDGKLNVNGQRNTATQGTTGTGCAKGGHGLINLQGTGTQLTVNSSGSLYCYGFIKGAGGVYLNGGTMYELLQIYDWAGGSNISSWYFALGSNKAQTLFFTGHYYLQNVESPLTVAYGSEMYAEGVLTVSDTQVCTSARVVGTESAGSGLFLMGSGTSITRTYNPATDRVEYQLSGNGKQNRR